jgi:hypothetical protein
MSPPILAREEQTLVLRRADLAASTVPAVSIRDAIKEIDRRLALIEQMRTLYTELREGRAPVTVNR